MPSLNSHADILRDWEALLEAVVRSPEVQAGVETERLGLEQWLGTAKTLKARQDELSALRQGVTQELNTAVARGKEAAIQLRAIVKAKFGPRSERLVHFKVAPLRRRPRRLSKEAAVRQPASTSEKPVA
jgi:hypothetical protein